MRTNQVFALVIILSSVLLLNINYIATGEVKAQSDDYLEFNRIIANDSNIFIQNDTIEIVLFIKNVKNYVIHDIHLNETYDNEIFSIISSTNTSISESSNTSTALFSWDILYPDEEVTYRTILRVIANKTDDRLVLNAVTIDYKATEYKLPQSQTTNTLSVILRETVLIEEESTLIKIIGDENSDLLMLIMGILFPLVLIVIFSFLFTTGRRK